MQNLENTPPGAKPIAVLGRGQIGRAVVARLAADGQPVRWLSRGRPETLPAGVEHHSLDVRDEQAVKRALVGTQAVIAAINPSVYDAEVWARELPPMHDGLIAGALGAGVRLVLLDALYLHGTTHGPLAPHTPRTPETAKGAIRLALAERLEAAQRDRGLRAVVLRAPDFWGPGLSSALLTDEGIAALRRGGRMLLLGDPDAPHAFAHRDDVVDALITLAHAEDGVEGEVFHAPSLHVAPRVLVETLARALGVPARIFVAPRWFLRLGGLFSPSVRGLVEMLPQWEAPYLVDDSAYTSRFGRSATSLEAGVAALASAAHASP